METTLTQAKPAVERSAGPGPGGDPTPRRDTPYSLRFSSQAGGAGRLERQCHELLALVGEAAIRRRYGRGEIIYAEGDSVDALYVLARGMAKLSKSYGSGGKEAILRLAGPWDVLGHAAFGAEAAREAEEAISRAVDYWNAHRHSYVWGRRRRHRASRRPGFGAMPTVPAVGR